MEIRAVEIEGEASCPCGSEKQYKTRCPADAGKIRHLLYVLRTRSEFLGSNVFARSEASGFLPFSNSRSFENHHRCECVT